MYGAVDEAKRNKNERNVEKKNTKDMATEGRPLLNEARNSTDDDSYVSQMSGTVGEGTDDSMDIFGFGDESQNSRAIKKICFLLFLDVLAFGLVLPILPEIILDLSQGDVGKAAMLQGLAASCDGLVKFFMQPMLGNLSDNVGRKAVLYYSLLGSSLAYSFFFFSLSVVSLFLMSIIHGLTQATFLVALSSISDLSHSNEVEPNDFDSTTISERDKDSQPKHTLTDEELSKISIQESLRKSKRTHYFGFVGVAVGTSLVIAPFLGSVLARAMHSNQYVYLLSTCIYIFSFFYVRMFVPETNKKSRRMEEIRINYVPPWRIGIKIFSNSRKSLRWFLFGYFNACLSSGVFAIAVLYLKTRWGWGILQIGLYLSMNGLILIFSQGVLIRWLIPIKISENNMVVVAYAIHAIMFLGIGLASGVEIMIVFQLVLGLITGMGDPSLKSLVSHLVSKENQGSLQGLLGSIFTLSQVISPPFYSYIFSIFVSEPYISLFPFTIQCKIDNPTKCIQSGGLPGMPFIIQSLFYLLAALFVYIGNARWMDEENQQQGGKEENEKLNENELEDDAKALKSKQDSIATAEDIEEPANRIV